MSNLLSFICLLPTVFTSLVQMILSLRWDHIHGGRQLDCLHFPGLHCVRNQIPFIVRSLKVVGNVLLQLGELGSKLVLPHVEHIVCNFWNRWLESLWRPVPATVSVESWFASSHGCTVSCRSRPWPAAACWLIFVDSQWCALLGNTLLLCTRNSLSNVASLGILLGLAVLFSWAFYLVVLKRCHFNAKHCWNSSWSIQWKDPFT